MRAVLRVLGLGLLSALLAGVMWAQGGATGAITGQVLDPSGAVVAGATVRIVNHATGQVARVVKTDAGGSFTALLLPVSTYDVNVSAPGFAEGTVPNVDVRVTETTRMTAKLVPQTVRQEVEVQGEVQAVDTTAATTGQSIESQTIRSLPLATQNFQQLLTLSTGAESRLNDATQLGRGDVRMYVNGQREDNNNYQIEGISATDYNVAELTTTPLPSPDVIQEFKVQTSLYDASQGRNGGGNVNAVLKSGTLHFHGDFFEFFRNDVLNANDFFLNQQAVKRPVLKQNIFGGSLGGPIGKQGKLGFFFVNYQGTRQRSGEDNGTIISTIFPVLPAVRTQQTLSQAFFGNSTTPIDPVVLKLMNFKSNQFGGIGGGYLLPSLSGVPGITAGTINSAPFVFSSPGRFTDDQFTANWDRQFNNNKDKVAARFFFSDAESLKPFGAGGLQASLGGSISRSDLNFPYDLPVSSRFLSLSDTHVFSNSLINDFRYGYVRINNSAINNPIVTASDLGINRPSNNVSQAIYKFTFFSSGFQIGPTPQADQFQVQNNNNVDDTVSWVHGKHQFRFGGDFTRVNLNKLFPQVFNGQLFFANTPASATSPALTDFQNFLLGAPQFSFGGGGVFNHEYRLNDGALFLQDDYRATGNLTLNLGLRTEIIGAFHDKLFHIGNVDPSLLEAGKYPFIYPSGVSGLHVPGLSGTANSTTLKNNYSTGWGPRLGFAYDLGGHQTTTIRGGYGIYYVREDVGAVDQLSFQAPFLPVAFFPGAPGSLTNFFVKTTPPAPPNPNGLPPGGVIDPSFIPVISQLTGFITSSGAPTTDTSQFPVYNNNSINLFGLQVPQRFVVPNTQQWNLDVQRALGRNWVVEAGYVGTHAVHLRETRDSQQSILVSPSNPLVVTGANGQVFTITTNTLANAQARTFSQGLNGYSGFELFANDAYSHYHSLQVTVSRRWQRGYFQGAYTLSRSTDATSTGNTAFNTAFNDQTNLAFSRGLSDFDRRHRLVVSYVYSLPFFSAAKGFKGNVLGGWEVTGTTIFQSGTPFSILDSGAGTAYAGATTIITGASLKPGSTLASGLTSGSTESRLNGYVNLNAFQPAPVIGNDGAATGFGNLGRNIYHGPFEQNWDFSLMKNVKMTERQQLRFTADFFNIFNHPVFSNPSFTDVESPPTFGHITTTENNPRIVQFSLRYAF